VPGAFGPLPEHVVPGFPVTAIDELAVIAPSCVVTVIVADPTATAVTRPVLLTVATELLDEVHITFLLVAFEGETVAVSC
jgi:hypothetical protein